MQASSLKDVLAGNGDKYYFDGRNLFIRMTDPGSCGSVDEDHISAARPAVSLYAWSLLKSTSKSYFAFKRLAT
jgi:hypothetical protein